MFSITVGLDQWVLTHWANVSGLITPSNILRKKKFTNCIKLMNVNTDGLPPEMQARIAQIIEKAKENAVSPAQADSPHQAAIAPPTPTPPPPSLMDHTIALRQEVASMSQQMAAMGQVVDAVGQAVGQLYAMFQQQTQPTSYSAAFQAGQQQQVEDGDY